MRPVEELLKRKEELLNELAEIEKELSASKSKVIYAHPCKDSSKHHNGKYKHWSKILINVDGTKSNGYAFNGDFLSSSKENQVPVNSYIIQYSSCEDQSYSLVIVEDNNVVKTLLTGDHKHLVTFIKEVKELTNL